MVIIMHEKTRERIAAVCRRLASEGLCGTGSGAVSLYDRQCGVIFINSSGSAADDVTADRILAVLTDGDILEGEGNLPPEFFTHSEVYKALGGVNSMITSDPVCAVSYAQAGRPIKPYGTAHAESFGDMIPCTRRLTPGEISGELHKNIGKLIVETLDGEPKWSREVKAILTCSDKVHTFGSSPEDALRRMRAVERSARSAFCTEMLMRGGASGGTRMQEDLLRNIYTENN